MNKTSTDEFLRVLKMFCVTFVVTTIACIIVGKVLYSQKYINLGELLIFPISTSIGSSIGYLKRYKKHTMKIMYEEVIDKEIIIELQKIMKKMHWSIKKNDGEQTIFKSCAFTTSLTEYLVVTINKDGVELVGPEYYVKKVVRKLNLPTFLHLR